MILYISFGQNHAHAFNGKTFDRDCLAEIEADTYEEGRKKAFEVFGSKWAFEYSKLPDMKFFPRGIIKI